MVKILLHSGGLDSHCAWWLGGKTAQPVYVRIGAPYESKECNALENLRTVDPDFWPLWVTGPMLGDLEQESGRIPHRNLLLAATAAAFTDASVVEIGAVAGEASPDKSRGFMAKASRTLTASEGRPVHLVGPIRHLTKAQALQAALDAGMPRSHLRWMVSCYDPGPDPCGECLSCYRRGLAEWACGLRPTPPAAPVRRGSLLGHARRIPVREWPGVIRNNVLAVQAWHYRRSHVRHL